MPSKSLNELQHPLCEWPCLCTCMSSVVAVLGGIGPPCPVVASAEVVPAAMALAIACDGVLGW